MDWALTSSLFKYGEFENVALTPAELGKLNAKFTEREAQRWIEKLSEWKKAKGRRPESDYATILVWARRAQEKTEQMTAAADKRNHIHNAICFESGCPFKRRL